MDDQKIIELLFERREEVLGEVTAQYSRLYRGIVETVLGDPCDIEECANDVLLALWNSIPPNAPSNLPAYICKIAHRTAIDKLRYNTSKKRNERYVVMLSELGECFPAGNEEALNAQESGRIHEVLSAFVKKLDPETKILFVRRYFYLESIGALAKRFEMTENHVSVKLYRARKKLKKEFEKEGIFL